MAQVGSLMRRILTAEGSPAAPREGGVRAWPAFRAALWPALGAAGLFLAMHPYRGIHGDARLYVGRALADLDPAGIGRDLMFVHDGQSRFSLFPLILRWLVASLGPADAALALSLLGMGAWFCGAYALAASLAAGRGRWIVLAALVVLPACYGYPGVFRVGEALATPRTLAEAAVLGSLAAYLARRVRLCGGLAILACLLHPIMGLAGLAVLALVLAASDRRWLAALAALPIGTLAAAALGVPLFDRLLTGLDPEFSAILRLRCAELFPSFWPATAWTPLLVQGASILVAGSRLAPAARRVLAAALLAGGLGAAVSALFGDSWPSLLIVQLQPWRFLWLTAVVGAAAFGLCAAAFWRGTPGERITLALLALGWVFSDDLVIAAGASGLALAAHALLRPGRITPTSRAMLFGGVLVGLLVAGRMAVEVSALAWLLARRTEGAQVALGTIRNFSVVLPLAILAGLAWTRASRHVASRVFAALALVLALATFWDERSETARQIERRVALPDLAAAVASRPGEVLWLDGEAEAWLVLGRANWITNLQGASIVFSRPLAAAWSERMNRLIAGGLASEIDRAPFHPAGPRRLDAPPAGTTADLCGAPDAPAWIVVPLRDGQTLSGSVGTFPLPVPLTKSIDLAEGIAWQRIVAYGLLACRP
jgi:hypothetical protein